VSVPGAVDRLAVANAPHPTAYRRQLLANLEEGSNCVGVWYAVCFQPWLPESACRYDEYHLLEQALRETAAPGTFTETDLARYRRS